MPIRNVNARPGRGAVAGILAALALMAAPAVAAAASAPAVSTGSATSVTATSTYLNGSIDPQGQDTTYFFQYGHTHSYGSQTAVADAGSFSQVLRIAVPVLGLTPLTTYHYRLIAINATGASTGGDHTFTTTALPLTLGITASPNPVSFGGSATIQGTLSGTGNAGRPVELQVSAFPFVAGFVNSGNPELTSATGAFSFPLLGLTQVTQYRVVTASSPLVVSPVSVENVAVLVTAHLAAAQRRHYVRFYGSVTPAEAGMQIGIVRVIHGRNILVAGTVLKAATPAASHYVKVLRVVRGGVYKVLARITDGTHVSAYSRPIRIG